MKVLRGRYRVAVWGAALAALAGPHARAQQTSCPPCLHDQVLQSLPADIEAVVSVSNAARQRASGAGRALAVMIQKSGSWDDTTRAWALLAKTLDWTPEKTFDELLGRRVSLVMRGIGADGGTDWSLLTEVSGETQKRLRERLRAAPRGAIAGLSVLSIEDGSFEVVVSPATVGDPTGALGKDAVVLLAPRKSEAMLDELVPALRSRAIATAAGSPAAPKTCDVVVVWRGGEGKSVTITAGALDTGWDATFVCSRELVIQGEVKQPVRKWSDSLFKQLETGSLAGVMAVSGQEVVSLPRWSMPVVGESWSGVLSGLLATGEPGMRVGAFVRAAAPGAPRATATLVSSSPRSLGAPTQRDSGPKLAAVVITEATDSREAMVKGDRAMAACARTLLNGRVEGAAGCDVLLEISDRGPRTLKFGGEEGLAIHPDLQPVLGRAFGEATILSWNTVRSGRNAWWVSSMAPENAEAGGRESRAVIAPETGAAKARLCMGVVRPAALTRWMDAIEPGMRPAGAEFVESLRWDVWVRDDGQAEGSVAVRMVAPTAQ